MSVRFCVIDENQSGFFMGSVKSVMGSCKKKNNQNKMLSVAVIVPLWFNNNNNNNNNCPRRVFGPRGPNTRGGTLGLPA